VLIVKLLLEHGASPDIQNNSGQTPLAIAQRLGYISVIEELKLVTQTTLVTQTIKTTEEKYKVQTPETMQETFMSDSEDELGKLILLSVGQFCIDILLHLNIQTRTRL
jgi:ankyrin